MKIRNNTLIEINRKDVKDGVFVAPKGIESTDISIDDDVYIQTVIFEEGLKKICDDSFARCGDLEKVVLPEGVIEIGETAFRDCRELKQINLPDSLEELGQSCFLGCDLLKEITLPEKLKEIKRATFFDCTYLHKINLGKNIKKIRTSAFFGCEKLQSIELPDSVTIIDVNAFTNCESLKKIKLSEKLSFIMSGAFCNCYGLEEIKIPESVKQIHTNAFKNCRMLSKVQFSNNIQKVYANSFDFINFKYLIKNGGEIYLSKGEDIKGEIVEINKDNADIINILISNYEVKDIILQDIKKNNVYKILYQYLYENLGKDDFNYFVKNKNLKFFKQFNFDGIAEKDVRAFIKIYFVLGGFLPPVKEIHKSKNGKVQVVTVDYAQKVGEFLLEKIKTKELLLSEMNLMFRTLKFGEFNSVFTKFFLNKENFKKLMVEESIEFGFISKCFNDFNSFQKGNTSNKGSQRQLQPTVEKFKDFFLAQHFTGINETNRRISDVIFPYFINQESFDLAVKIDRERREKNIRDSLLLEDLKEEDVFIQISKYKDQIEKLNKKILGVLIDLSNKQYTFEWLKKSDPVNFILGKLCTCCAHLQGFGYGIMKASIVHPDVQNLVIRNERGDIIAKSTLYINRDQRYGVFNNVEVNDRISDEDKKIIYAKYKKAVRMFAEQYNKENPQKPLLQITVGMNANDLEALIRKYNKRSSEILKAIDYSIYRTNNEISSGDSGLSQYIIWQKEKDKNREQTL